MPRASASIAINNERTDALTELVVAFGRSGRKFCDPIISPNINSASDGRYDSVIGLKKYGPQLKSSSVALRVE